MGVLYLIGQIGGFLNIVSGVPGLYVFRLEFVGLVLSLYRIVYELA